MGGEARAWGLEEGKREAVCTNLVLPFAPRPHPFLMIYLSSIDCPIKSQVPLATLTLRVGGPAQWYVAPRNLATSEF